jgi:hypothetical protein
LPRTVSTLVRKIARRRSTSVASLKPAIGHSSCDRHGPLQQLAQKEKGPSPP